MSPVERNLVPEVIERLLVDPGEWLSCDDCFAHVDEYVERLTEGEPAGPPAMRGHLRGCSACAEEAATLALLVAEETGRDPSVVLALLSD